MSLIAIITSNGHVTYGIRYNMPNTETVLCIFSQNQDGIPHTILVGKMYLLLNRYKILVGKICLMIIVGITNSIFS